MGYALGGGAGGWVVEHFSNNGVLLLVALLYLPSLVFAVWRPDRRND